MKITQSLVLAMIVLGTSACASNAVKQPPAASPSVTQSTVGGPVTASDEASLGLAIRSTEAPNAQGGTSDEVRGRQVSDDGQSPDARIVIDEGSIQTTPLADASSVLVDGSTADTDLPTSAEEDAEALYSMDINDPWERYNRAMYKFNTKVDKYIARPIGVAYDTVVPDVAQRRVTSFFANLREPLTLVNQALQGRPIGAARTLGRFVVNTTAGVGGLFDPASKLELHRANEDLGQTLAVWGWDDSRFFVAPLQGPRTVRDFLGGFGDRPLAPIRQFSDDEVRSGLTILQIGSMRSAALPLDKVRADAVDEYAFVRDAWMQRRKHQIETK